jgi:hypothetical protein
MASNFQQLSSKAAMANFGQATGEYRQMESYRAMAKEALESVAIYNARAQWFESSGNHALASEYRLLSQEALTRALRYKELADLAEKHSSGVDSEAAVSDEGAHKG